MKEKEKQSRISKNKAEFQKQQSRILRENNNRISTENIRRRIFSFDIQLFIYWHFFSCCSSKHQIESFSIIFQTKLFRNFVWKTNKNFHRKSLSLALCFSHCLPLCVCFSIKQLNLNWIIRCVCVARGRLGLVNE